MKGMLNEAGTPNRAGIRGYTPNGVIGQGPVDANGNSAGVLKGDYSVPYANPDGAYGDYYLPNVVMPMLRRIMPDLIANDLVGVQPLNGPVGYALAYRPIYGQNGEVGVGGLTSDAEIGFNPTDTRWTGSAALTANPPSSDLTAESVQTDAWNAYAGNGVGKWLGEG